MCVHIKLRHNQSVSCTAHVSHLNGYACFQFNWNSWFCILLFSFSCCSTVRWNIWLLFEKLPSILLRHWGRRSRRWSLHKWDNILYSSMAVIRFAKFEVIQTMFLSYSKLILSMKILTNFVAAIASPEIWVRVGNKQRLLHFLIRILFYISATTFLNLSIESKWEISTMQYESTFLFVL